MRIILRRRIENVEETLTRITHFQYASHVPTPVTVVRSTPNSAQKVIVENLVPFLTQLVSTKNVGHAIHF